jgi:hypothetical protein
MRLLQPPVPWCCWWLLLRCRPTRKASLHQPTALLVDLCGGSLVILTIRFRGECVQLSFAKLLVCSRVSSMLASALSLCLFGSMHADAVLHLRLLRPPPTLAPLGGGRCAAVGVGVAWQRACVRVVWQSLRQVLGAGATR